MQKLIEDVDQVKGTNLSIPLMKTQLESIRKFADLLATDRATIRKNGPKARAHDIMSDVWTYSADLYLLIALAVKNPTTLGSLDSADYFRHLKAWWPTVSHPKSLTDAVNYYWQYFPTQSMSNPCISVLKTCILIS